MPVDSWGWTSRRHSVGQASTCSCSCSCGLRGTGPCFLPWDWSVASDWSLVTHTGESGRLWPPDCHLSFIANHLLSTQFKHQNTVIYLLLN